METRKEYPGVKLFCGVLYRDEDIFNSVIKEVIRRFENEIDLSAGPFDFNFTDYYSSQMGQGIKRRFMSFKKTVSPENPYLWKILTNEIEKEFYICGEFPRRVNLDPGYMNLSRVILFSTKDFYHRIYLGKGIFAEVTLYFEKGRFMFLPWTYPDYKTEGYLDFFRQLREVYKNQLQNNEDVGKSTD